MIILDENTRCLVQGITGKQGSFHTRQMLDYGTKIGRCNTRQRRPRTPRS
jgi:succinyl-CoA synthetase alpha subunit